MRSNVKVEDIVAAHQNLLDMTPNQAILTFIEMLKSWPMFGSMLFEVSVSVNLDTGNDFMDRTCS